MWPATKPTSTRPVTAMIAFLASDERPRHWQELQDMGKGTGNTRAAPLPTPGKGSRGGIRAGPPGLKE